MHEAYTDLLAEDTAPLHQHGGCTPEVGHIVLIQATLQWHDAMQHVQRIRWFAKKGAQTTTMCCDSKSKACNGRPSEQDQKRSLTQITPALFDGLFGAESL